MLKDEIIADMMTAMKARAPELDTLRMLKADIMKYEVSGADKVATDEVVIDIVKRSIKQRKEAAEGFTKGGNMEAAAKEISEIAYFEKYMPEQMNENQVKEVVQTVIDQLGESAQFGQVMGASMSKMKGKADGGLVNKIVKELMS